MRTGGRFAVRSVFLLLALMLGASQALGLDVLLGAPPADHPARPGRRRARVGAGDPGEGRGRRPRLSWLSVLVLPVLAMKIRAKAGRCARGGGPGDGYGFGVVVSALPAAVGELPMSGQR